MTPPQAAFDPDDAWCHTYSDIASLGLRWRQGSVTIKHLPGRRLQIENYRQCPNGYRSFTRADLRCRTNILSTPLAWSVRSKVARQADGTGYLNSELSKTLRGADGQLHLDVAGKKRTYPLAEPYTCKWCLLDAVGRMATQGTESAVFTLLDEYDEVCPEQTIRLRGESVVKTRGGAIDVWCYQHTGIATVPGVFYVDRTGRVLAYLAGMELLVLGSTDTEKTGYER